MSAATADIVSHTFPVTRQSPEPSFAPDQDETPQRGSGRPIRRWYPKFRSQPQTQEPERKALTPDFLALSYIADLVREAEPQQAQSTIEHSSGSWASCVAGTLTPGYFLQMVTEAGFLFMETTFSVGENQIAFELNRTLLGRLSLPPFSEHRF